MTIMEPGLDTGYPLLRSVPESKNRFTHRKTRHTHEISML
jgi:hypothetical protein